MIGFAHWGRIALTLVGTMSLVGCGLFDTSSPTDQQKTYQRMTFFNSTVFVYPKSVLFQPANAQIAADVDKQLAPVIQYAKAHPKLVVQITSFDNNAPNSALSVERVDFEAEAVAAYLWTQQVPNTLKYGGVGRGRETVSSNRVASIGAANRRIEIEFFHA